MICKLPDMQIKSCKMNKNTVKIDFEKVTEYFLKTHIKLFCKNTHIKWVIWIHIKELGI